MNHVLLVLSLALSVLALAAVVVFGVLVASSGLAHGGLPIVGGVGGSLKAVPIVGNTLAEEPAVNY
jgi:hypothetical protein